MRGPISRKLAAIETHRKRALQAGLDVGGAVYDIGDEFVLVLTAMTALYQAGTITGTQTIYPRRGASRDLTGAQIANLLRAVVVRRQAIDAATAAARAGLESP